MASVELRWVRKAFGRHEVVHGRRREPPVGVARILDQEAARFLSRSLQAVDRDLLVQAVTGAEAYLMALPVLAGWTLLFVVLAVVSYRNDEGRRFR